MTIKITSKIISKTQTKIINRASNKITSKMQIKITSRTKTKIKILNSQIKILMTQISNTDSRKMIAGSTAIFFGGIA